LEWWLALAIIFGGFLVLMLTGLPVAFCFTLVNLLGVFLFWGGQAGLRQLILSIADSVTNFALLPIPLFILMGEVMFHSGVAPRMIDVLATWLGRLPGRLSLLSVGGGALFATLSGAGVAGVAMLGSVLVPDMEKRGYKKPMTLGPIIASGSLAIMIPPSALGVLLASLGQFSVGGLLIAIILPGLTMALFYAIYIIVRCWLQPSIAPSYEVSSVPLFEKVMLTVRYVLPLGFVVFLVVGLIFLGIATPTEAAALGALGCFILAFLYKGLNWEMLRKSLSGTLQATGMMFLILTGSAAFAQIMAFTGASQGLVRLAVGLPLSPIFVIIAMQLILVVMGTFMDPLSIMMVTIPIYMPIVLTLGFNPVWFGTIMLLNMETATISPPFGLCLFVMKGVAPPDTTMGHIYRAALPFVGFNVIVMALIIAVPMLALWLPGVMH
jgi:tripartite ATP-independent transporter DctM subunit